MRNSLCRALALVFILMNLHAQAQTQEQKLEVFFKAYLDDYFRMRPMEATRLGDHRFDCQLDDLSAPARAAWRRRTERAMAELPRQIDYASLSRPAQIDFEILQHSLKTDLWLTDNLHPFREDPRVYNGYINDCVYLLLTQSTMPLETNVANCIARMGQIPRIVAAARENLRNPPRVHTETAIRQNRGAINFYQHDLFEFAGATRQLDALKAAAVPVVDCLKQYQDFLEKDLLPRANGEWRLGPKKFARKLDLELDAAVNADQVMADAEAEFARVTRDMYVIARQLWSRYHPGQALPPDDPEGRRATVEEVLAAVAKDHGRSEDLTREMVARVARLKKFITDNNILQLPEPDRCQVVEMPEFRRGNSTAYMEAPPPLDPNAAGQLAVSPPPKDWDARRVESYLKE